MPQPTWNGFRYENISPEEVIEKLNQMADAGYKYRLIELDMNSRGHWLFMSTDKGL